MNQLLRRRHRPHRGEQGAALELALIFLAATALIVGALITFASTSSNATTITRTSRGTDYDADAVMQADIATIRATAGQGYSGTGNCVSLTVVSSTAFPLNNPNQSLRVECNALTASGSTPRHVVLSVCLASVSPCTDAAALLRADVDFYDDGSFGRAVSIQSWSNQ